MVSGGEVSFKIRSVAMITREPELRPQKVSLVGLSAWERSRKLTAYLVDW